MRCARRPTLCKRQSAQASARIPTRAASAGRATCRAGSARECVVRFVLPAKCRNMVMAPPKTTTTTMDMNARAATGTSQDNPMAHAVNGDTAASTSNREIVHIEVRLQPSLNVNLADIRSQVKTLVLSSAWIQCETALNGWRDAAPLLAKHVERIRVCEAASGQARVPSTHVDVIVHAFHAASQDDVEELMADDAADDSEQRGQDDTMAATVLELPNESLEGIWENLIYSDDIKPKLLRYIYTTLLYSDARIDANIIAWNRLLLLHGPPGTGKTSLCRALAQKLSIRLVDRFAYGKLVEINSHSLFSKWFSESGKLVQRLFTMIHEMISDPDAFVVVLIDEVESLTAARTASASSGAEPSDAVRVVNALLTQLDKLKRCPNVLVVTTSNLSESIDNAFIDRADIKQFIGPPPPQAIYWILQSCLLELMRVKVVEVEALLSWDEALRGAPSSSLALAEIAQQAQGLSGRTLRRLPVLAHAKYIGMSMAGNAIPIATWLQAIQRALVDARIELQDAEAGSRKAVLARAAAV